MRIRRNSYLDGDHAFWSPDMKKRAVPAQSACRLHPHDGKQVTYAKDLNAINTIIKYPVFCSTCLWQLEYRTVSPPMTLPDLRHLNIMYDQCLEKGIDVLFPGLPRGLYGNIYNEGSTAHHIDVVLMNQNWLYFPPPIYDAFNNTIRFRGFNVYVTEDFDIEHYRTWHPERDDGRVISNLQLGLLSIEPRYLFFHQAIENLHTQWKKLDLVLPQ